MRITFRSEYTPQPSSYFIFNRQIGVIQGQGARRCESVFYPENGMTGNRTIVNVSLDRVLFRQSDKYQTN